MIRYRRHDASFDAETVPLEVDVTCCGRDGERIDVVPGGGVCEFGNVPDSVGEEGGGCGVLGVEEGTQEDVDGVGRGGEVLEGDGCGCAVAEGAPGSDWGGEDGEENSQSRGD